MAVSLLEIGQFVSILLAAGTPGMTYYVMGRQHKQQIANMEEKCKTCKAGLDAKIGSLDDSVEELDGRQRVLRQETLPDEFVKRRELDALKQQHLDALKQQHEKDVEIIHKRIDRYHPTT